MVHVVVGVVLEGMVYNLNFTVHLVLKWVPWGAGCSMAFWLEVFQWSCQAVPACM